MLFTFLNMHASNGSYVPLHDIGVSPWELCLDFVWYIVGEAVRSNFIVIRW